MSKNKVSAPKTMYRTWASNKQGASTEMGDVFHSKEKAKAAARSKFGPGWTIHLVRMDIWGAQEEIERFTTR